MKQSSGAAQLDLLLLKAESYSKFILENQERSQALHKAAVVKETAENDSFKQPPNLTGGTLLPHQIEGLQWLLSLWENGLNGILADEMGLGKTIQIISLIAHLRHHNTAGPYLIAGPLATLQNWVNEFNKWLPSCPVILYHGDKKERELLRKHKMPIQMQKTMDFPIIITSFELCIIDRPFLEKYHWQYIILDEGHRIKNRNCRLLKELKSLKSVSRLLLTGTPIQNSLEELWSLLNFCSPAIFDDLEIFQSWFDFKNIGSDTQVNDILDDETNDKIVSKLHEILRPFVLRRLKYDTIGNLIAAKKEIVVYCGMSNLQYEYYNHVVHNTLRDALLISRVPRANRISQINMLMNYRKVCNHPFLFGDLLDENDIPVRESNPSTLIAASGKFRLLDRMLPKFYQEGRKVILFSQMTELLNLIEDYLHYRNYSYERFDGSTKLVDRQESINNFNQTDNKGVFVFLLSTRAGGLGINLTAADTAILFDSDWNPHVDSQAQDRCHRIGQTKNVVIYRFLTLGSVEIEMMKRQVSKKKLERLTIHGGDFRKAGKRSGKVTVEDLRRLLQDDVNLGQSTDCPVQQDISDKELDIILNRELLFPDGNKLNKHMVTNEVKEQPKAVAITTPIKKKEVKTKKRKHQDEVAEIVAEVVGEEVEEVEAEGEEGVPGIKNILLEGEMFDIVLQNHVASTFSLA